MGETIGYIGLGAMGLPMARRLAAAGHRLVVHDVDAKALAEATAVTGIEAAGGIGAVCAGADLLITCLPRQDAVEAVYAEVGRPGLLACDCSTIMPSLAIRLHHDLAARGVRYVECPMLGNIDQAAAGELFLILAGADEDVRRLAPILGIIGRDHRHVGGPGQANLYKVVQNGLGHVQMVGIAEALAVIAKAGADPAVFCEVVAAGGGMAATPLFQARAKVMLSADPEPKGRLRIGAKDAALAATLAMELGLEGLLVERASGAYQAAMAMGLAEADAAEVARAIEARAGVILTG